MATPSGSGRCGEYNSVGEQLTLEQLPQIGVDLPLGLHVPLSLKETIWNSAYFDISSLCTDTATSVVDTNSMDSDKLIFSLDGDKLVVKKPGSKSKKIDTYSAWQSAFHIYMAIYLAKHPFRAGELLKYSEIIRTASIQFPGQGWKTYDEQFRMKQATNRHVHGVT